MKNRAASPTEFHLSSAFSRSVFSIAAVVMTVALALLGAPQTANAATYVVNSMADTNDGVCSSAPGGCSLREAVNAANAAPGDDVVLVPAGNYLLNSQLLINSNIKLQGAGQTSTVIDGQGITRVLYIQEDGSIPFEPFNQVSIRDLTLRNGNSGAQLGGGIFKRRNHHSGTRERGRQQGEQPGRHCQRL